MSFLPAPSEQDLSLCIQFLSRGLGNKRTFFGKAGLNQWVKMENILGFL